ncbi:DUF2188 domain-containing protein [Lacticaseibacillus jixianensis]|uniref:DUF2188 domain-containing protein n=1 Tax=Lacticaseibacillus jixianensis TaxID=2486012 RepID=A0ABW4BCU8_9LACO|nr:DUF2188 domain-containing protein [Lacticaseibacillus jixianensis]
MPWDMTDYPPSMKYLTPLTRKMAIAITNALLADGYKDDQAIPIATSHAKKWYEKASVYERRQYGKTPAPTKHDQHHPATARERRLHTAITEVRPHEDGWAIAAKGAKRAAEVFEKKADAVARAKEIARNKDAKVAIYKRSGDLQETIKPR